MLVTIEGLDGVGKSTLMEGLIQHYGYGRKPGKARIAEVLVEPWSVSPKAPSGKDEYRDLLKRFYNVRSKAFDPMGLGVLAFMTMDRFAHVDQIRSAKKSGVNNLILMDRYYDSTSAYQAVSITEFMDVDSEVERDDSLRKWVEYIDKFQRTMFPVPDVTLYLNGGWDVIERKTRDSTEQLGFRRQRSAKQVMKAYKQLILLDKFGPERIFEIDAKKTVDQVLEAAVSAIESKRAAGTPI